MTIHFATSKENIEEEDIDASRIFNLDECGCNPDREAESGTRTKRLMILKGSKDMSRP